MLQKIISYFLKHSIRSEEKIFFIQHLALMLRAGISLPRAIKILSLQAKNKYWRGVLDDIRGDLMKGNSFERSLTKYKDIFGPSFVSMVRVGELKGDLASILDKFYKSMQLQESLKRKIKSAISYPIVVLTSMVLLSIGIIFYILPRLMMTFQEVDLKLPLPTRILIGVSSAVTDYGFLTISLVILFLILFAFLIRTRRGKYFFNLFLLKLPIISPIIKERNLALLSRNLGTLLRSGVPISEALLATSNVLNNLFYKQSVLDAREEINKGNFVHTAFVRYPEIYPNLIIQIMVVGEEAGVLDEVLMEMSSFYEKKIMALFESLTSIIEPILIFILGIGVAFIALSILLPIYQIAQI